MWPCTVLPQKSPGDSHISSKIYKLVILCILSEFMAERSLAKVEKRIKALSYITIPEVKKKCGHGHAV